MTSKAEGDTRSISNCEATLNATPDVQSLTCRRGIRRWDQLLLMVKLRGRARLTGADHQRSAEESVQHQHSAVFLCACVVRPLTITYYARVNLVQMGVKIPSTRPSC